MSNEFSLEPNKNFKPSPEGRGAEARALAAVCNFVNDPYTKGLSEAPSRTPSVPVPPPVPTAAPAAEPAAEPEDLSQVFYTGKLGVGKDHVAAASGATIFGFADPLYALVTAFFGVKVTATEGKDIPGVRQFLQTVGNWGRGEVNEQYPLTPARANFVAMIQSGLLDHPTKFGVEWNLFGKTKNLWVNATLARIHAHREANPGARVAVTNCRYPNEYAALQQAGFVHYHVTCSPSTWAARLAKRGLKTDSPVLKDTSERLAHQLDADVVKKVSAQKNGPRLHCIWNDPGVQSPSGRLVTTAEFLSLFSVSGITADDGTGSTIAVINTGE